MDVPKAGFGNTNDGNANRRFFMDPKLTATITRVDEQLIYRLKIILDVRYATLACGIGTNAKAIAILAYRAKSASF